MTNRTTILGPDYHGGELHVDYDALNHPTTVYLHMGSGGFSHCVLLTEKEARAMAEALMKAAYRIEDARPKVAEAAA